MVGRIVTAHYNDIDNRLNTHLVALSFLYYYYDFFVMKEMPRLATGKLTCNGTDNGQC